MTHPLVLSAFSVVFLGSVMPARALCTHPAAAAPAGSWEIVFEDDFSGTFLNESNWTPSNLNPVTSQYDGHSAMFISDRVAVKDGTLVLTTMWDPRTLNGVDYNFTSAWVDSQHKRNMTRGRFEASMRMPVGNATGAWPAWWLLPENACWPVGTEIDIVEYYVGEGHNQHSRVENPAQMSSSFHYGYSCGDDLYRYPNDTVWWPSGNWTPNFPIIDFSASFNTFGVEINDTAVRFYVNDVENTIFTVSAPTLCVENEDFIAGGGWGKSPYMPWAPLYGILNTAMNRGDANLDWWKTNNATTLVDWVKFWEYVPSVSESAVVSR
jgi:beta-glucanase (GH16 family)